MTTGGTAGGAARRAGSGAGRVIRAWRALPPERRMAAIAAVALFLTLFLPWYQETVIVSAKSGALRDQSAPLTGWAAFSFVEAAVLLVAAGVLTLLFQRAEGRAFHLPGGDGWVVTAAGAWTCVLIVWRFFDKQSTHISGPGATTAGIEWGIFVALAVAAALTYAGSRIRAAATPEPPLPEDDYEFPLPPRRGRSSRASRTDAGGRAERRERRQAARESATYDTEPTRITRRREPGQPRPRTSGVEFPTPEPLEDPPTMRFGEPRRPARSGEDLPAPRPEDPDEQLTIPFEDVDRDR